MRRFAISILAVMLAVTAAEAASLKGADVVIAPGGGLNAQIGKTGSGAVLPASQIGGTLAPLSAEECKALGGEVTIAGICNSGSSCQRRDENGKTHEVCLSVK
jgi:hypothetical protein